MCYCHMHIIKNILSKHAFQPNCLGHCGKLMFKCTFDLNIFKPAWVFFSFVSEHGKLKFERKENKYQLIWKFWTKNEFKPHSIYNYI